MCSGGSIGGVCNDVGGMVAVCFCSGGVNDVCSGGSIGGDVGGPACWCLSCSGGSNCHW